MFALRLARLSGARKIYGITRSGRDARDRLALAWGADAVIHSDQVDLSQYPFAKGGVEKMLMTATPDAMPDAMKLLNVGGVMGFIGIGTGDRQFATFDMRHFHDNKLQIRQATPCRHYTSCLSGSLHIGMLDMAAMISHTLHMDTFQKDVQAYLNDHANALKAVMIL